jgi:REP element-mobilizing transposase RayT
MPDTLTNLLYHAVFATHERAPLIGEQLRPRLHAYIGGIVRSTGGVALEVGGTSDHAHLLARLPPGLSVSDAMRTLKSNSSRWMNQQLGSGPGAHAPGSIRPPLRGSPPGRASGGLPCPVWPPHRLRRLPWTLRTSDRLEGHTGLPPLRGYGGGYWWALPGAHAPGSTRPPLRGSPRVYRFRGPSLPR